jgi:hypothetical protein
VETGEKNMPTNIQPREADFDRVVDQALREAYEHQEALRKRIEETKQSVAPHPRQESPAGSRNDAHP